MWLPVPPELQVKGKQLLAAIIGGLVAVAAGLALTGGTIGAFLPILMNIVIPVMEAQAIVSVAKTLAILART